MLNKMIQPQILKMKFNDSIDGIGRDIDMTFNDSKMERALGLASDKHDESFEKWYKKVN